MSLLWINDDYRIKKLIDEGKNSLEIAEEHFGSWCRYRKSFDEYRRLRTKKQARQVRVIVLWGKPGTGKTGIVFDTYPDVWISSDPKLQWFDGYRREDVVLLDEYRGEGNSSFLLRLLDRYPLLVPIKGGFIEWCPRLIFICSNMGPPFGHHDVERALERRITTVIKMDHNIFEQGEEVIENIRNKII